MNDMDAFDRQIANEVVRGTRSPRSVDDHAVFQSTVAATQSPKWRFGPMFSATKFLVAGAIVALLSGLLLVTQYSEQRLAVPGAAPNDPGTFSPTGSLAQPRGFHTATLLPDGRVLVVGGVIRPVNEPTSTVEVWDPETGTFSPTGSLAEARAYHSATLLPDGRVLVVGGCDTDGSECHADPAASAEVWDPSTETFSAAGTLAQPRSGHAAALLPDGRVLIVGDRPLAEVWDPATSTFSPAGSAVMRWISDATLLPDGRVLVVGGERPATAEVWDPETSTFSPAGMSGMGYANHAALMPDGRVLVVGEGDWVDPDGPNLAKAEIWDPATSTFSPAGSLHTVEAYYSTTALQDGRVLVVGGCTGHSCHLEVLASAEVWDPDTEAFGPTGSLDVARWGHTVTLMPDGRVLVVGGESGTDESALVPDAEVWTPHGG